ncbi:MAG: glycerophosphoryl diester phosphodiesterase membrane domain-containing protein [Actinobacteria bacterium]|nr:glycerophosphoryl diester phosphodiesterase membrane domain-containing protein [Actinomycetota bacterium]
MTAGGGEALRPDGVPAIALAPAGREHAPRPGTVPLRPLSASDVITGVFTTAWRYRGPLYLPLLAVALGSAALLSGCAAIAWKLIAPLHLLHLHGERMTAGRVTDVAIAAAVVVVPAVACAVFASAVAAAVSVTVLGHHAVLGRRPLTARQAWAEARPQLGRTLGVQLLTALVLLAILGVCALPVVVTGLAAGVTATAFGLSLLLLIPGLAAVVYAGGRLLFAVPATVLEGTRPAAAMRRSWQLNRGAWWRIFGVSLLPGLIGEAAANSTTSVGDAVAARFLPASLSPAGLVLPVSIVVFAIIAAAVIRAPLRPLTLGLLYIDRCIRKERLHVTLDAAARGAVSHAPFPLLPQSPPPGPPRPRREREADTPEDDLLPYGDQRPARGRGMIGAGWVLRIAGTSVALTGLAVFQGGQSGNGTDNFTSIGPWLIRAAGFAGFLAGGRAWAYGRLLVARGKRHTVKVIGSFAKLIYARYVLYLRPFSHDKEMAALPTQFPGGTAGNAVFFLPGLTQEESLVRRFGTIGRVIAIGRPGEDLPLPGATRGYLPRDDWQDVVSGLIRGAHVVALAAGTGRGTVWEFTEAVRLLDLRRLVLLVYCDPAMYDEFREAVRATYDERRSPAGAWPPLPELPDFPPLSRPRRSRPRILMRGGKKRVTWDFPLKGIVVFDKDRKPAFIRFDPTAVRFGWPWNLSRMVKRKFAPVLSELAALPRSQDNDAHGAVRFPHSPGDSG